MSYPIISDDPAVQAFYEARRAEGTCHNMAEIFATRRAPGCVTDREFWRPKHSMTDVNVAVMRSDEQEARAAGINTNGMYYMKTMSDGRGPQDPEAWVAGRGDVKRLCEKRNYDCEGTVKHKAHERVVERVGVADDVVAEAVSIQIEKEPEKAPKAKQLAAEYREKHTPHWLKTESGRVTTTNSK